MYIGLLQSGGINGPSSVQEYTGVLMDLVQCICLARGGGINGHTSVHAYHEVAVLMGILVYRPTMRWRY